MKLEKSLWRRNTADSLAESDDWPSRVKAGKKEYDSQWKTDDSKKRLLRSTTELMLGIYQSSYMQKAYFELQEHLFFFIFCNISVEVPC